MRACSPLLCLAILILSCTPAGLAQAPYDPVQDTTNNPLQSYHGSDIDSIELSTGTPSINIPLISYPERGGILHLDYFITFRGVDGVPSGALTVYNIPFSQGRQMWSVTTPGSPGGGFPSFASLGSGLAGFPSQLRMVYTQTGPSSNFAQGWLTEQDGSAHPLGWLTTTQARTLDGSGFYVVAPTSGTPTFIDKNGVVTTYNSTATTVTDPNGNQITFTNGGMTDTMGRQIPSGNCPSGASCFPGINGTSEHFVFSGVGTSNLQTVTLPNNTSYSFQFTPTALPLLLKQTTAQKLPLLTKVTLPTGGSISYTYTATLQGTVCSSSVNYYFPILSRTVDANDGTGPHTWHYQYANSSTSSATTTVTDPVGNVTVYTYGLTSCQPYATQIQRYDNAGHLLQTETRTYSVVGVGFGFPPLNVNQTSSTITWPNGQQSKKSYAYDRDQGYSFQFGAFICGNASTAYVCNASNGGSQYNPTPAGYTGSPWTVTETDYGSGAPGPLLRQTKTIYMSLSGPNSSSYLANNMLSLPYTVQVLDGGGVQRSYTLYAYDEYGLANIGAVTIQHNSAPPSGSYRGNVTSLHRWLSSSTTSTTNCPISVSNGYLVKYNVYNDTGTVDHCVDFCGTSASDSAHKTTFAYSATYAGAYVTTITNPLNQSVTQAYDFNTGLLTTLTDPNNQPTSYSYDNMFRIASANFPDQGQTALCFTDAGGATCTQAPPPFKRVITKKMSSTSNFVSTTVFDGVGRVTQTQLNSAPQVIYVDTAYDALGRAQSILNPHFSTVSSTDGTTTRIYDALGRTTQITQPDGSVITTSYSGNTTTVTDEAGKKRQSQADGLGRLTQVVEDPGGLGYVTTYSYDGLSNLTGVVQNGSRHRTFNYNSLSQLTSATNPESGTVNYTYDANGNLGTKTAPAPNQTGSATVTTTYSYDALNRMTLKTYSDGTTPYAQYIWDANYPGGPIPNANNIGRLATTWSPNYTGSKYNYDPVGRVANSLDCIDVSCNWNSDFSYTYDLLGNLTAYTNKIAQWTSPPVSSITFNQQFDSAGRVSQLTSSWVDAQHPATLATVDSSVGYFPHGALRKATLGNGLTLTNVYNNRLQPCHIDVNQSNTTLQTCNDATPSGNILDFSMTYSDGTNNGNVAHWNASSGYQSFARTYGYDQLNRISSLSQTSGIATACSSVFSLSWTYDAWGNRSDQNVTAGTCNAFHQTVNTQNRLLGPPYQYDAAGNMIQDASHTYTYDAENRLIKVDGGATASYVYDPTGRRVQKTIGGTTKSYVYDLAGNTFLETQGSNWATFYLYFAGRLQAQYKNGVTSFIHGDHLGSTRFVTDMYQYVSENLDYLPFGEVISTDSGLSTHKFTGKERDSESGLDNFGARYDSSSLGRFMSPDSGIDQHPEAPQSWNLYSYALNNPLNLVDPTGEYVCGANITQTMCDNFQSSLNAAQQDADKLKGTYGADSTEYKDAQRAIDFYGKENVDNGVTLTLGGQPKGAEGQVDPNVGSTSPTSDNPLGQKITVHFGESAFSGSADNAILLGHEGSHGADASDWVRSGFSPSMNPNQYNSEWRAFHVSVSLAVISGYGPLGFFSGPSENKVYIWQPAWTRQAGWGRKVDAAIDSMLRDKNGTYGGLDPRDKLGAFRRNTKGNQ